MARTGLSPLFTWRSAIAESDLGSTTKLVAFALSLHMNERGGSCFPSIQTLARETSLGVSTVREHIGKLESADWLLRKIGGGRKSNRYTASVPTPPAPGGVRHRFPAGTPPAPGDESVIEAVMEDDMTTTTATTEDVLLDDLAHRVLAAFNEEAKTDFRAVHYLEIIEAQIRTRPDLDLDKHRRAIRRTLDLREREKWWKGSPSPDMVYANERAFERALNLPDNPSLKYTRD